MLCKNVDVMLLPPLTTRYIWFLQINTQTLLQRVSALIKNIYILRTVTDTINMIFKILIMGYQGLELIIIHLLL